LLPFAFVRFFRHAPACHPAIWSLPIRTQSKAISLLVAAVFGSVFAVVELFVNGVLAAIAIPRWYVPFLMAHKHLAFQFWSIVEMSVPIAILAAICGVGLAKLEYRYWLAAPLFAVVTWLLCRLVFIPAVVGEPLLTIADAIHYFPIATVAGMLLPALALPLAYRTIKRQ
jgi:hypothetical protein